ncbi:MAG: adenylate/guanylate cyclase domain-containing protein [Thermodesulfovibrionales bacterium]
MSDKTELLTLDTRFKLRHTIEQSDRIVLVNIDDPSIELYGQWPWSRRYQVALLETLSYLDTGYIIYDVFFSEHEQPTLVINSKESVKIIDNDVELQRAIKKTGNVYLAYPSRDSSDGTTPDLAYQKAQAILDKSDNDKKESIKYILSSLNKTDQNLRHHLYQSIDLDPPIPDLLKVAKGHGFAQPGYSKDGIVRNFIFFKDYNGYMINALAYPVILDVLNIKIDNPQITPSKKIVFSIGTEKNIGLSIDNHAQSLINWVGSFEDSFIHISFKDIIYLNLFMKAERYLKDVQGLSSEKMMQYIISRLKQHALLPDKDVYTIARHIVEVSKKGDTKITPPLLKARVKGEQTEIPPDKLKGKIILIGLTGKNTIDLNPTPFEASCPMVFYHANAINMFLTGQFLSYPVPYLKYIVAFTFAMIVCFVGVNSTLPKTTLLSLVVFIAFLLVAYIFWIMEGHWIEVVIPTTSIVSAYLICLVFQVLTVYKERSKIKTIFSAMVSPKVLVLMEKNPSAFALAGERRFATTYFSKIEGIEPLIQSMSPAELPQVLSHYLTPMSNIIMEYDGYIDKYEGTVIMADFGVPLEDSQNPIKCAFASIEQGFFINAFKDHIKEFYMMDAHVSIGINSGYVSAGNMGSERKFQYTVMGDPVNTAARLMASNSIYRSKYCITSEDTFRLIKDFVYARPLDKLLLKGKTVPTKLYDLLGWKADGYLEFIKGKKTPGYLLSIWAKVPAGCIISYKDFWNRQFRRNQLDFARQMKDFFESHTDNGYRLMCLEFIRDVLLTSTEIETASHPNNIEIRLPVDDLSNALNKGIETLIKAKDSDALEDLLRYEMLLKRLESLIHRLEIFKDKIHSYISRSGVSSLTLTETKDLIDRYRRQYETSVNKFIKNLSVEQYHKAIAIAGEPEHREIADIFSKGLDLYWQRRWDDAIETFGKAIKIDKDDKPSQLMIDRINQYKISPPDDRWQGEFLQTKK